MNPINFSELFNLAGSNRPMRQFVENLKDMTEAYRDFSDVVTNGAFREIAQQQAELTAQIKQLVTASKEFSATTRAGQAAISDSTQKMQEYIRTHDNLTNAKRQVQKVEEAMEGSVNALTAQLRKQMEEFNGIGTATENAKGKMKSLATQINQTKDSIAELNNFLKEQKPAAKIAADSIDGLTLQLKELQELYNSIGKKKDPLFLQEVAADIKNVTVQLDQLKNATKVLGEKPSALPSASIAADSLAGLRVSLQALETEYSLLSRSTADYDERSKSVINSIHATKEEITTLTNAMKVSSTGVQAAAGSYLALDMETKQLQKDLIALEGGMDANNAAAATMQKQISENIIKLKAFDATLGIHKREVGNYATATFAVSQVLREFPAFAYSIQTGILALSNNVPILMDEFRLLSAQLGSTSKALSVMGESLFGMTNIITIAIGLLTVFGGELFKTKEEVKAATDANDEFTKSIERIGKASRDGLAKATSDVEKAFAAITNANLPMAERIKQIGELRDKYPEILKNYTDEALLAGNVADAIARINKANRERTGSEAATDVVGVLQARQDAARNKLLEMQGNADRLLRQNQELAKTSPGFYTPEKIAGYMKATNDQIAQQKQFIDQYQKLIDKAKESRNTTFVNSKQSADDTRRTIENIQRDLTTTETSLKTVTIGTKAHTELLKQEKALERELALARGDDPDKKGRKDAARDAEKAQREAIAIIKATEKLKMEQQKKEFAESERSVYDEKFLADHILEIHIESIDAQMALESKNTSHYIELQAEKEKAFTEHQEAINKANQKFQDTAEKRYGDYLKLLKQVGEAKAKADSAEGSRNYNLKESDIRIRGAERSGGLMSGRNDAADEQMAIFQLRDQALTNLVDMKQRELDALEDNKNKSLEIERQYYDKKAELSKAQEEREKNAADATLMQEQRVADAKKATYQAVYDFTGSLINTFTDMLIANDESEIDSLKAKYDYEVELAGDNKKAKKTLETQYNKDLRKARVKEAYDERSAASFQAGINAAIAASKAIADYPFPYSLIVSGLALAAGFEQVVAINSKPIPNYFVGRGKGKSELAVVNERGPELIENNGQLRIAGDGKPTLTYLDAGDTVHTHEQSKRRLSAEGISYAETSAYLDALLDGTAVVRANQDSQVNATIAAMSKFALSEAAVGRQMRKAMQDIVIDQIVLDENGFNKYRIAGNQRRNDLRERNKFGGNG